MRSQSRAGVWTRGASVMGRRVRWRGGYGGWHVAPWEGTIGGGLGVREWIIQGYRVCPGGAEERAGHTGLQPQGRG